MRNFKFRSGVFLLTVLVSLSLFGCGENTSDVLVTWFDADGEKIDSVLVSADYDPTEKTLPEDTDMWHYTGWTVSESGNVIVCTATRETKTKVIWKDFDGIVIEESFIIDNQTISERELPVSDEKWTYTGWDKDESVNEICYTAQKIPNTSYFCGNVFQIAVKDRNDELLGVGSGFVINKDGWFITNNHVLKDGYKASAFFDIKDAENGGRYTNLDIIGGIYNDEKKDIFIGKIANYEKIQDHYKEIIFTEEYAEGDNCYSVGYPDAAITLEINAGQVLVEYSNIRDKINGVYYLLSDCYIAPGSSGGILINEKFEVIGITSMGLYSDENNRELVSGGSVPTFAFKEQLKELKDSKIRSLDIIYRN